MSLFNLPSNDLYADLETMPFSANYLEFKTEEIHPWYSSAYPPLSYVMFTDHRGLETIQQPSTIAIK